MLKEISKAISWLVQAQDGIRGVASYNPIVYGDKPLVAASDAIRNALAELVALEQQQEITASDPNAEQKYYLDWAQQYKQQHHIMHNSFSAQGLAIMLAEFVADHKNAVPVPNIVHKIDQDVALLLQNQRTQDRQDLHDFRVALLPVVYAESTLDVRSETIADNVNRMAAVMLQRAKEADHG